MARNLDLPASRDVVGQPKTPRGPEGAMGTGHLHAPPVAEGWVQILAADEDLAGRLPEATVAQARPFAVAPLLWPDPGPWRPEPPSPEHRAAHMGLLVLDGFFLRRVDVVGRPASELLGPGDLLLPWEAERTEPFEARAEWEVLEPACVAVLDRRFAALVARWPDIVAALVARAVARSRALTLPLAIGQLVGTEVRLEALLWHLATCWGTRDGDATVVPVHLTYELLASLISAHPATVTRPLRRLRDRGLVSRRKDGLYVLHGQPPAELRGARLTPALHAA
jgi:CRP/FNR family transcriptional regulator, cyclic AMP receptor protein